MGVLWELFQEYQISKRKQHASSIEERVAALEEEIEFLERLLEQALPLIEEMSGRDIQA